MAEKKKAVKGSFEESFLLRWADIKQRGKTLGLTVSHICKEAGVARATPDRWEQEPPLSIALIDKLEAVVTKAERSNKRKEARVAAAAGEQPEAAAE